MALSKPEAVAALGAGGAMGGAIGGATAAYALGGTAAVALEVVATGTVAGCFIVAAAAGSYMYRKEIKLFIEETIQELKKLVSAFGAELVEGFVNLVSGFYKTIQKILPSTDTNLQMNILKSHYLSYGSPAASGSALECPPVPVTAARHLTQEQQAQISQKAADMFRKFDAAINTFEIQLQVDLSIPVQPLVQPMRALMQKLKPFFGIPVKTPALCENTSKKKRRDRMLLPVENKL